MALAFEPGRGKPCIIISTRAEFDNVVNDSKLAKDIATIRENLAKASALTRDIDAKEKQAFLAKAGKTKSQLPGFVFQCKDFTDHEWIDSKGVNHGVGKWRHQEHGILNGLFMVDYDHIENPREKWEHIKNSDAFKMWRILFAFVTSSNEGLKVVGVADTKVGNLIDNQKAFSKIVGMTCDDKCKDASRLSFAPGAADILYIDDAICTTENEEFAKEWQGKYSDGSTDQTLFGDEKSVSTSRPQEIDLSDFSDDRFKVELQYIKDGKELPEDPALENLMYHEHKVKDIINAYFNGQAPAQGDRHDSLLYLSSALRYVVEKNGGHVKYYLLRLPFVQDLYREGDDVLGTINDGLAYKYTGRKPKKITEALAKLSKDSPDQNGDKFTPDTIIERFAEFGRQIEDFFKDYPCLKDCCYGFKTPSYPAVLFSAGALFGTLATRCFYHFYHKPEQVRRLNYEIFIIADPANCKSSIGELYKLLLAPIIAADKVSNDAINKYKQSVKNFANSPEKKKKEAITYPKSKTRIHGSRTANNIFIEDMVNNVEVIDGEPVHLHLFTFDAELDSATAASKGGQWIDKSVFELKAFHNEEDNQQYRNVDSYTGPFDVFWNFIYTGTPFSLNRKVTARNFGSGLSTRLAVIPLCAEKYKMMPLYRQSKTNIQVMDNLKSWAFKLDTTKGELPFWPLVEHCWRWVNTLMTVAEENKDDVTALLIKRVPYYGINVAAPFILMRHWDEWNENHTFSVDATDKKLVSLIMEIQYYSQKIYFSKYAENYFNERVNDVAEKKPRYENTALMRTFSELPDEFSRDDLMKRLNCSTQSVCNYLNRLEGEGLITRNGYGKRMKIRKTSYGKMQ